LLKKILQLVFRLIAIRTLGGYESKPFVGFYSRFTKNTYLGNNCNFNGMVIRGFAKVEIGDNFHSGKGCKIINTYHKYDRGNAIPYDTKKTISKDVVIKENVWLGDQVLILGGVIIEEGAIIQAGSVVVNNIPKYAIAGGNPAKVFKYRDKESYIRLKNEMKFI
jgi:acetyltransferase-like isoleucine patch superfamily enzyme